MGSPSSPPAPSPAIPGALSTPLGSNHVPEGGAADSSEAVGGERPALTEGFGSGQDFLMESSQVGHSNDLKGTDVGTHPSSPIVGVVPYAPRSSTAGSTAASGLPYQDPSQPRSLPASPMKQSPVLSHSSPVLVGSPKWPMDQPRVVEELAPAILPLPGSGQLSPDPSKPSVFVASSEPLPPAPFDHTPDCAGLLQDSFVQLPTEAGSTSEVRSEEDGADSSCLDVSLEGGARVPMDCSVIEQLCDEAAKEVTVWDQCLSRMMVNEHPGCEFPHVSGIRNNMEFYRRTEVPARKALYDEFHDSLLRNDLTEDDVNMADPFTVCYVLARLLHAEYSLPEELLPAMEACLKEHCSQIIDRRAEKIQSIEELNSRLEKLSEPEAVPAIVEGSVVPSHWESDSSFQSEEPEQQDSLLLAIEGVKTEEPPEVKTEGHTPEPVKLEDQLLLPLLLPWIVMIIPGCIPTSELLHFGPFSHSVMEGPGFPSGFAGESSLARKRSRSPSVRRPLCDLFKQLSCINAVRCLMLFNARCRRSGTWSVSLQMLTQLVSGPVQGTCSLACSMPVFLPWICSFLQSTVKLRRLGARQTPAPCPLQPRTDWGSASSTGT